MKMQCSAFGLLLVTTLLNTALAFLTIDTYPNGAEAGKSYTITYSASPADKVVTFTLRRGLPTALTWTSVLGTANNGSYTWIVSRNLPSAQDYGLQITADDEINYSAMFGVTNDGSGDASSSGTSQSSASPTLSTISTGEPTSPTPSATFSGYSSVTDLTTGGRVGIGVGSSLAAILLASGAFFLGIFVRKKRAKKAIVVDTESGSAGDKPELDGKAAYHEMDEDSAVSASKVFELAGEFGQGTATHKELDAEPRKMEIDSSEFDPPRHELLANTAPSAVSPISDSHDTEPTGRDTTNSALDAESARIA